MSDPFDVLLAPTDPVQPSPRFAAELRRRLLADLSRPQEVTVGTVTPYLIVRNAQRMLDFYRDAFGAVVHHSLVDDSGRVGHAELTIGTSQLQLADEHPEYDILGPESRGGSTCSFTLEVPDVDAAFARAVELGATVRTPPADQFHGNRTANVIDPAGHQWMLLTKIEDLTPEQYAARAADGGYRVEGTLTQAEHADGHRLKHHGQGDLYYFNIASRDPARTREFLSAVLGWQFRGGRITNISAPPGSVNNQYHPDDVGPRLWFVVDDIHAAVAKVVELGGTATDPVHGDSGWSADCTDAVGVAFSLTGEPTYSL
jgi:uncharacterized glyoxalase superfamily protein PhnB